MLLIKTTLRVAFAAASVKSVAAMSGDDEIEL
jgi:hypothetical protein